MQKRVNIEHILVFCAYEAIAAIAYGFAAYNLKSRGFDYSVIGICLSMANVTCITLTPIVSNFIDNSKKYTAYDACILGAIILVITGTINYFLKIASVLTAIVSVLYCAFLSMMESLVNTFNFSFINRGVNVRYGVARAIGSGMYGIVCAGLGVLTNNSPYTIVLLSGVIFAICFAISVFFLRKDYNSLGSEEKELANEKTISFKEFFKNHKMFILLCLTLVGIYYGYTCIDNFMLNIVESVGGKSSDLGKILGFKALFEVPAIFFYEKLEKKAGNERLLRIAALFFIVKCFVVLIAQSTLTIYIAEAIQCVSFALMYPAMVSYVDKKMSKMEAARGQASFTTSICIGSIISSTIGGSLIDLFGTRVMILVSLIVTIIAAFSFIIVLQKQN